VKVNNGSFRVLGSKIKGIYGGIFFCFEKKLFERLFERKDIIIRKSCLLKEELFLLEIDIA